MIKTILGLACIVELLLTIVVACYIAGMADTYEYRDTNNFFLSALSDFIKGLFIGRNWFGVVLGVIVFVITLPAILMILLGEVILRVIFLFIFLVYCLWCLGNKHTD